MFLRLLQPLDLFRLRVVTANAAGNRRDDRMAPLSRRRRLQRGNPSVYNSRDTPVPSKQAYGKKDQQDWARYLKLPVLYRPSVFPVNSVRAMRACIVLDPDGNLIPFARAAFKTYWVDDKDISQPAVLTEICTGLGI